MTGPRGANSFDDAAGVIDRLAMLLEAGVSVADAREALDDFGVRADAGAAERSSVGGGNRREKGTGSISAPALVEAVLSVARESGAPLVPALRETAGALRQHAEIVREIEVAAAGPRMTARLVAMLPLLGLAVGGLLGFDPVGMLLTSVLGVAVLGLGVALMMAGALWARSLVHRTIPVPRGAGALPELVAIAVTGGVGGGAALQLAVSAATEIGMPLDDQVATERVLDFGRRSGVPVAPLLRGEARLIRQREAADARMAVERLGGVLLMPIGLCSLPSFLALGVLPMLMAVVSSTVTTS